MFRFLAALALLSLAAFAAAQPGTDPDRQRLAAAYSEECGGLSMLVMHRGTVIFEQYAKGHSPQRAVNLASGTKSFSGAMAAAAVADGLLALDEKVCDTITEWKGVPRKQDITIRQLLSLTSGIEGGTIGAPPSYREALDARARFEPGTRFQYGPAPFQIFGELLARKLAETTGENPVQYLERRVLKPIGCEIGRWNPGRDGNPPLPSGASFTAREWAKFGELIRNEGRAKDGTAVLPAAIVRECVTPSPVSSAYGITFWLRSGNPESLLRGEVSESSRTLPMDVIMAAGLGKQRLYIIPSLELVVVRQAPLRESRGKFRDEEFLGRLLGLDAPNAPADAGSTTRPFRTSSPRSRLWRRRALPRSPRRAEPPAATATFGPR